MTAVLVRRLVTAGVGIGLAYAFTRQCRKPAGWLGRRVARMMNVGHARLAAWALEHVRVSPNWRVLDIGCGGGRTISTIAELTTNGSVDGVDYSAASVAVARETNLDRIRSGRVSIQQASVSHLPFDDGTFDLAIAVETHYYWPDLSNDLREIRRVLKPGGRVLVIAETYKGRRMDWLFRPVMRFGLGATYLTLDEHRAMLVNAGFAAVALDTRPALGWICVLGTRPA